MRTPFADWTGHKGPSSLGDRTDAAERGGRLLCYSLAGET